MKAVNMMNQTMSIGNFPWNIHVMKVTYGPSISHQSPTYPVRIAK